MSDNTFLVMRLSNEPGKFIVMPQPSPDPPSGPPFGLVPGEQTFRGTEEETRRFLADKRQSSLQIQTLIDRAKGSPEINAPEFIVA
ncbi:MAG: hypothetical protein ABSH42_11370 [Bryobacteraceae bacterium]